MAKNFTIFPDYLSNTLRIKLLQTALNNWHSGAVYYQPCGKRGYFNLNDRHPEYLTEIDNLLLRIMEYFNVTEDFYRPARHFIGINLPTAFVAPHIDQPQFVSNYSDKVKNWIEIRFNTFLQRCENGGIPIIDKTLVPLKDGESLAFRADVIHSTTPVLGNTTRVTLSIGSVVNPEVINFLNND